MSGVKKIAFLGGSFNPVHKGHILGALEAARALGLDRLVLIPNACPPHKSSLSLDFEDRVNMLRLATQDYDNIEISTIESDSSIKHYTFNTLALLKEQYASCDLFFIIGTDSLYNLHTWFRGFELLTLANLICIRRANELHTHIEHNVQVQNFIDNNLAHESLHDDGNYLYMLNTTHTDISSSTIREAFKHYYNGDTTLLDNIKDYIDDKVINYILKHHLYA